MAKDSRSIKARQKQYLEEFSNYENAVGFISTLETWFMHKWGPSGRDAPALIDEFDRFPKFGDLTPDFAVRCANGYTIVGEHIKTFREAEGGDGDATQVVQYSRVRLQRPHDVLVFTDAMSDNLAAEGLVRIRLAAPSSQPEVPVVIIGYYRDRDRINGEWYNCKWRREQGNGRFTCPNICDDPKLADLNTVLVDTNHHSIRITEEALALAERKPLINDPPPLFYVFIRLVFPSVVNLIPDNVRDAYNSTGQADVCVTRESVCTYLKERGMDCPSGLVQKTLSYMVSPLGIASQQDSTVYLVHLTRRLVKDLKDRITARAASAVDSLRPKGGRRRRRPSPEDLPQLFKWE